MSELAKVDADVELDGSQVATDDSREDGGAEGEGGKKAKPADEAKLSKREHEQLLKRLGELEQSERYWSERARAGEKPEAEPDDEPPPEDDEPPADDTTDQFIEDLSKKGLEALVKRGVLTKKAAIEIIQREARKVAREVVGVETKKLATDAELIRQFPDLEDRESALFKRTGELFREDVKGDPTLRDSPRALILAARTAKAELALESKGGGDDSRAARIRAQAGDRSGSRGFDEDQDTMGPAAREIAERMGVSEKQFRAHRERRAR